MESKSVVTSFLELVARAVQDHPVAAVFAMVFLAVLLSLSAADVANLAMQFGTTVVRVFRNRLFELRTSARAFRDALLHEEVAEQVFVRTGKRLRAARRAGKRRMTMPAEQRPPTLPRRPAVRRSTRLIGRTTGIQPGLFDAN